MLVISFKVSWWPMAYVGWCSSRCMQAVGLGVGVEAGFHIKAEVLYIVLPYMLRATRSGNPI
jgi:hypothetical protein